MRICKMCNNKSFDYPDDHHVENEWLYSHIFLHHMPAVIAMLKEKKLIISAKSE